MTIRIYKPDLLSEEAAVFRPKSRNYPHLRTQRLQIGSRAVVTCPANRLRTGPSLRARRSLRNVSRYNCIQPSSLAMPTSGSGTSSGIRNCGRQTVVPVLVSRSSDRRLERRYHSAIPITVAGIALVLLGETNSQTLSIVLWSFVAMGIYSFFGPFFSIPSKFLAGFSAAAGIALINSVGNLGGFVGPSVIGAIATGSTGIYGGLAVAGVALVLSAVLVLLLPRRER